VFTCCKCIIEPVENAFKVTSGKLIVENCYHKYRYERTAKAKAKNGVEGGAAEEVRRGPISPSATSASSKTASGVTASGSESP